MNNFHKLNYLLPLKVLLLLWHVVVRLMNFQLIWVVVSLRLDVNIFEIINGLLGF